MWKVIESYSLLALVYSVFFYDVGLLVDNQAVRSNRVDAFHLVSITKHGHNHRHNTRCILQMSSTAEAVVEKKQQNQNLLSDFEEAQLLMPSIVERALIQQDDVDAEHLLNRLDMTPKEREIAMIALQDEDHSRHLLSIPLLSSNDCQRLRNFVDSKMNKRPKNDFGMDDVDRCPDFQVHMTVPKLRKILGKQTMDRLLQVPNQLLAHNHVDDDIVSYDAEDVGIFLRRYEPDARPWMPFHLDQNAFTVNVALNSDEDFEGGRLLALYSNKVEIIPRNEGDATCHRGSVVHGVSCITQGCRYSMILFFH